jgi:hypothetical protein
MEKRGVRCKFSCCFLCLCRVSILTQRRLPPNFFRLKHKKCNFFVPLPYVYMPKRNTQIWTVIEGSNFFRGICFVPPFPFPFLFLSLQGCAFCSYSLPVASGDLVGHKPTHRLEGGDRKFSYMPIYIYTPCIYMCVCVCIYMCVSIPKNSLGTSLEYSGGRMRLVRFSLSLLFALPLGSWCVCT